VEEKGINTGTKEKLCGDLISKFIILKLSFNHDFDAIDRYEFYMCVL